jgi:hypothetical protein
MACNAQQHESKLCTAAHLPPARQYRSTGLKPAPVLVFRIELLFIAQFVTELHYTQLQQK